MIENMEAHGTYLVCAWSTMFFCDIGRTKKRERENCKQTRCAHIEWHKKFASIYISMIKQEFVHFVTLVGILPVYFHLLFISHHNIHNIIMTSHLTLQMDVSWVDLLTCKYKIPLHIDSPRNHVSVTSHTTVGGKHNMITRRSATAKFTMNILVTVRIVAFAYTAMHTNILPIYDFNVPRHVRNDVETHKQQHQQIKSRGEKRKQKQDKWENNKTYIQNIYTVWMVNDL